MAKNRTQRNAMGIMLIRRIFDLYDCVDVKITSEESIGIGGSKMETNVNMTFDGMNLVTQFKPTQVEYTLYTQQGYHDGKRKYSNTATETIQELVSVIVSHIKKDKAKW